MVSSSEGDASGLEPDSPSSPPPESSLHIWSCSWVLRLGPFQGRELAEVKGGQAAGEGACDWPQCWPLRWRWVQREGARAQREERWAGNGIATSHGSGLLHHGSALQAPRAPLVLSAHRKAAVPFPFPHPPPPQHLPSCPLCSFLSLGQLRPPTLILCPSSHNRQSVSPGPGRPLEGHKSLAEGKSLRAKKIHPKMSFKMPQG